MSAVLTLTAIMTLLAPLNPAQTPRLDEARAMPIGLREYTQFTAYLEYNWDKKQFNCLDKIWTNESH